MKNKQTGITLIALVITIIVLLILAGITISVLTGEEGLLSKVNLAKEKDAESSSKEKLQLKIYELQAAVTSKEGREATLSDLDSWKDTNSSYYDAEIINVVDGTNSKLVYIDQYIFKVNEKLEIVGTLSGTNLSKTETTYQVNSINGNTIEVTIKVKNESGIEKIVKPDGNEVTIQATNKTNIAIDYTVESGQDYIFKIQAVGSSNEDEYVLKADIDAKPQISQNTSYAYPVLSETGVTVNKIVTIDFGENTDNYYSLDEGQTWNKYTDDISIDKECKLSVKTIKDGEITKEDTQDITLELADDAVGAEAYDGDEGTYWRISQMSTIAPLIKVDTSAINKKINIKDTYRYLG